MRCEYITIGGKQCSLDASPDSKLCSQHDNSQKQVIETVDKIISPVKFEDDELETLEYFNLFAPDDPLLQWSLIDVKAELYKSIADSMGAEDYFSITDTYPRDSILIALEERVEKAQKIVPMVMKDEYFDQTKYIDEKVIDSDKLENIDILKIFTVIINKYIIDNKNVTYTTVQKQRNSIFGQVSEYIVKNNLNVFED